MRETEIEVMEFSKYFMNEPWEGKSFYYYYHFVKLKPPLKLENSVLFYLDYTSSFRTSTKIFFTASLALSISNFRFPKLVIESLTKGSLTFR